MAQTYGVVLTLSTMIDNATLDTIQAFRSELYSCLVQRSDALFEILDTALTSGPVSSLAHLSLETTHRRGWGSLYAALANGKINVQALRELLADYRFASDSPIYAVDTSVWPRCDAKTSPDRGWYYHSSNHVSGHPVVSGWTYQFIVQLNLCRDSWTNPLDVKRVHPTAEANATAVEQIKALLGRQKDADVIPLFVFDAGYDPVKLTQGLEKYPVAILVRLRSDRCFYADPPVPVVKKSGRPRRHGAKFIFKNPLTWPVPTAEHHEEDSHYGTVRVRAWSDLHSIVQAHPSRGTAKAHGSRPVVRGTVILIEVSRLPAIARKPKQLCLWWHGPVTPDLSILWRAYIRRFDIEHTFRFFKQTLNWVTPRPRLPEQADRWTWLLLAAYTQLRLAKQYVVDVRLPWEQPLAPNRLTPNRVRRAFLRLLTLIGTPANPPKPCGRSPGRPKGRRSQPAIRHPVLKKTA